VRERVIDHSRGQITRSLTLAALKAPLYFMLGVQRFAKPGIALPDRSRPGFGIQA
jgi:hypothetical protein